jgi:hypothetical protein
METKLWPTEEWKNKDIIKFLKENCSEEDLDGIKLDKMSKVDLIALSNTFIKSEEEIVEPEEEIVEPEEEIVEPEEEIVEPEEELTLEQKIYKSIVDSFNVAANLGEIPSCDFSCEPNHKLIDAIQKHFDHKLLIQYWEAQQVDSK